MHLPRSVFSQRQLDLFLWLLKVNDVEDVPSVRSMLGLNTALQRALGVNTIAYKGALGHHYYANALDQIIAQVTFVFVLIGTAASCTHTGRQEMANPRVRPHLHFYPEETDGRHLSEARQAARWLHEVPDEFLTPMVRLGSQDFYVHEPTMLRTGAVCMPVQWFNRVEGGDRVWYANCWKMETVNTDTGVSWRVIQDNDYQVRASEFFKTFPELMSDMARYGLPSPSRISGEH